MLGAMMRILHQAPALLTLVLTAAFAPAQTPGSGASASGQPEGFERAWRDLAAEYHQLVDAQAIVGSSLGFFQGKQLLGGEVHGYSDLETKRKVDADTIYHWASITKTFTGIAIMQLRDRGLMRLDDPILDY